MCNFFLKKDDQQKPDLPIFSDDEKLVEKEDLWDQILSQGDEYMNYLLGQKCVKKLKVVDG